MTKTEAVLLLGAKTQAHAASMLGLTKQGFSKWPFDLEQDQADRVRGCAVRHGRKVPKRLWGKK